MPGCAYPGASPAGDQSFSEYSCIVSTSEVKSWIWLCNVTRSGTAWFWVGAKAACSVRSFSRARFRQRPIALGMSPLRTSRSHS